MDCDTVDPELVGEPYRIEGLLEGGLPYGFAYGCYVDVADGCMDRIMEVVRWKQLLEDLVVMYDAVLRLRENLPEVEVSDDIIQPFGRGLR